MNERDVLVLMGDDGFSRGIEAVAEYFKCIGFHEVAKELCSRMDTAEEMFDFR
jgi:hypothetical protein